MILAQGDKVMIVHRRLYQGDNSRYFVGVVDGYSDGIAKVSGHSWLRDHCRHFERADSYQHPSFHGRGSARTIRSNATS